MKEFNSLISGKLFISYSMLILYMLNVYSYTNKMFYLSGSLGKFLAWRRDSAIRHKQRFIVQVLSVIWHTVFYAFFHQFFNCWKQFKGSSSYKIVFVNVLIQAPIIDKFDWTLNESSQCFSMVKYTTTWLKHGWFWIMSLQNA